MKKHRVVVSDRAKQSLKEIVTYIRKESPDAAVYVRKALIGLIKSLETFPEKYAKELLLEERNKNYRSAVKWHYKIIYLYSGKDVIVLDIIHTSMNPDVIKDVK